MKTRLNRIRSAIAVWIMPAEFEGRKVPEMLLSGHHGRIAQWRQADALMRTLVKRPDLLFRGELSDADKTLLRQWRQDIERLLEN